MTIALEPSTREFYRRSMLALQESGVEFLMGGAYAFACCTGIERHTKDLDVFVRPADVGRALEALGATSERTERTFPHWLAKAYDAEGACVDVIHGSGNAIAEVDDAWFAHANRGEVLGVPVRLCSAEEMVWSKAFVMERERFDGADVAHLLRASAGAIDWRRLLDRFGPDWRLLQVHLTLFAYIYPAERDKVPAWVVEELADRLKAETGPDAGAGNLCRGPLLSRSQYLIDLEQWGYRDARLAPDGRMMPEEVAIWTRGIDVDGSR
jgi:hypothetical protein